MGLVDAVRCSGKRCRGRGRDADGDAGRRSHNLS